MGGFWGDLFSGDWGNAFNINELKPGGIIPDEINNPKGALTALAGGLLLGPAVGSVIAPLAGTVGSAVGGVLNGVGAGGVASALGSLTGSTIGSTAIGLGTGALAANAIGGLLGGAKPNPQAIGVGTLAAGAPTYDKTLLDAFNAQLAIEPQLLAANQLYQPQWLDLQKQSQATTAQNQMDLMAKLYPQSGTIEAAYQNQLRQNQLQQLQSTLPQYQQAFNALTPGYAGAIASTGQLAQNAMQRANVAPQLTAFENQVGTPYGPSPQMQVNQQIPYNPARFNPPASQGPFQMGTTPPPGGVYPNGLVWEGPESKAIEPTAQPTTQPATQTTEAPKSLPQTDTWQSTDPSAPNYFVPPTQPNRKIQIPGKALFANKNATAPAPTGAATASTSTPATPSIPLAPALPPGVQGPQAPSNQYLYDQSPQGKENERIRIAQLSADNAKLAQMPQPTQQQAWGQATAPQFQQNTGPMGAINPRQSSLQNTYAGDYANRVGQFRAIDPLKSVGQTAARAAALAGAVPNAANMKTAQTAAAAAKLAGAVPTAENIAKIAGPQLKSGLETINKSTVNQYVSAMPGMQAYANSLSKISKDELAAGRGLTPEEDRMAQQAARAGYAARGTALGGQAVAAEVLNRADVANQRYQQRLVNAQNAATGIQNIYQPALDQSLERQKSGLSYNLGAQNQAFSQASSRDTMLAQLQAQKYGQLMNTQGTGFNQAQAKDNAALAAQAQKYQQSMGTQGAGYTQALSSQNFLQGAQQQNYTQAMGREALLSSTQASAFDQALKRSQAEQQRLQAGTSIQAGQAQLGAGALGQLQAAQQPILQAYYQQPILQQTVNQAQTMGLANQQAAGNTLFQPESSLAFQSAFLPYQSNIALQQSQMTANAGKQAGTNSMMGSIGGSIIGALPGLLALCWVAREVYGTQTGTWKIFRSWMLNEAPEWLRNAYIKHGPKVADFIKDKPVLKAIIRRWMDSKIKSYLAV